MSCTGSRRGRWLRRVGNCTLALLIGAALFATAQSARAAGNPAPVGALPAFGACLQQHRTGDLLLVIDSSGSLASTDPDNQRVVAAQLLLTRLVDTSARSRFALSVSITSFDYSLASVTGWTPLTAANLPSLTAAAQGLAIRNKGFETDYWTALTQARGRLAARRTASPERCQAMLIFTDGRYELSARTDPGQLRQYGATKPVPGASSVQLTSDTAANRVAAAGEHDICRPGGVADQLRVDGITTIAIGLSAPGSSGSGGFGLLSGIAANADHRCGNQPGRGLLVSAANVNDLIFIFNSIGDPNNPSGPVVVHGVCRLVACASQAHTFALDASIKHIHLLGAVNAAGVNVQLRLPNTAAATTLSYQPASRPVRIGSTALTISWLSRTAISIDADFLGPAQWSGTWSLVFIDPTGQNPNAVSKTQLTISGDLLGRITATKPVVSGETAPLELQLIRTDGTPAELGSVLPRITADITAGPLSDPAATVPIAAGLVVQASSSSLDWTVPASFAAGPATVTVVLHVTTRGGLVLADQTSQAELTVAAPPDVPVVGKQAISFGQLSGTRAGTAMIPVTGTGCVWLAGSALAVFPEAAAADRITSSYDSAGSCLHVTGSALFPVKLVNNTQANGSLQGSLSLRAAPPGLPDRAQPVPVTFTASLQRLPNRSAEGVVFGLAMLIGLGVPVLLLLLLRYRAARLPAGAVQSLSVDAIVTGEVARLGSSAATGPERWRPSSEVSDGRRTIVLDGQPGRARAGWRLDSPGHVVLQVAPRVGVGAASPHVSKQGEPTIGLQLRNSWAFAVSDPAASPEPASPITGRLLVIVGMGESAAGMAEAVSTALRELPGVLAAHRARWPSAPTGTSTTEPTDQPAAGIALPQWVPPVNPDSPWS